MWFYVPEHPKAQQAAVLSEGGALKSRPTDWESQGLNYIFFLRQINPICSGTSRQVLLKS